MFVRVLFSLKHFLRYQPPTSDLSVFHILMSMVFDHERAWSGIFLRNLSIVSDVIKFSDMLQYVSKGFFLRNAYDTKTPVGTFQRFLWMFLFGDNFASLPTMYFRYPVCGHLCLGLRCLGCG